MFNTSTIGLRITVIIILIAAVSGGAVYFMYGSAHAQTAPTTAPKTNAAGAPIATAVANRATAIRKALPPAPVLWSPAVALSDRALSVAKPGSLITRLPKPQLDAIRVPVILPRAASPIRSAVVNLISFDDAYSMNLPQDSDPQHKGTQITIYGTRTFVKADQGALSLRPITRITNMAEDVRISQMEDGWTASFTRFGVVYSVDVTCDEVKSPDCQTDGYIRKAIVDFTDVAAGVAARAEAKKAANPQPTPAQMMSDLSKRLTTMMKPTTATKP